ncbi:MAG: energy-coupled thiamine transporter ThiT [Clostridia bacterium]|nr:energy-coupled thiamine transporter ThiT [Clostridia bacterium]
MNLQEFFDSIYGQISIVVVILILFGIILYSGKGRKADTRALAVSALLVALAVILNQITLIHMPQGGSVTVFSMVPVALCAYIFGVRRGLMAGMVVGLLSLVFHPYVIHPIQLLLDYPLAFGALALGGVIASGEYGIIKGYIMGVVCRYICTVISGAVFFGAYAPAGFNAWTWSIWYNATYIGIEAAITVILLFIPAVRKMFEKLKFQMENN